MHFVVRSLFSSGQRGRLIKGRSVGCVDGVHSLGFSSILFFRLLEN